MQAYRNTCRDSNIPGIKNIGKPGQHVKAELKIEKSDLYREPVVWKPVFIPGFILVCAGPVFAAASIFPGEVFGLQQPE